MFHGHHERSTQGPQILLPRRRDDAPAADRTPGLIPTRETPTPSAPAPGWRRRVRPVLGILAAIALPPLMYYLLHRLGMSSYLALLIVALATGLPALYSMLRPGPAQHVVTTFFALASVAATVLAIVPSSPQFLLVRDAVITAGIGAWFISTLRKPRPIVYTLTRPMLEGRMTWPGHWEEHWERAPRFRRMWRHSTILWGCGFLFDAGLRVALSYTLEPDVVPAATTAMYLTTILVLVIASTAYCIVSGMFNPHSALFAPADG